MKKKDIVICTVLAFIAIASVVGIVAAGLSRQIPTLSEAEYKETANDTTVTEKASLADYGKLSQKLSSLSGKNVSETLLKSLDKDEIEKLKSAEEKEYSDEIWHSATGFTLNALIDKTELKSSKDMGNNGKSSFTVSFTGDINFTESGYVMTHAENMANGVLDCIDETFQDEMRSADIMFVNNEFPYTDRGSPTPGKKYTFRAKPESVKYMTALGVDIVSLANNHAYDYGYDSFIDTISTLDKAGIIHVGAGMNSDEAAECQSFLINGYKVGFLACCGVESPIKTPIASSSGEGIMGSYDDGQSMIAAIKRAKEECDYVFVYPHWGIESTTTLTNAQQTNSKNWIDAGADAVIGDHPHVLQGMEFYKGVPVIYSMGNFWFNTRSQYTGLLKLIIDENGIQTVFVPGRQSGSETHYLTDAAQRREVYDMLEGYQPYNKIKIDDNGVITPAE